MALVLKSISFNTNGDARCGSLHCRKNYDTPIPPTAILKDGSISPVIVLVPREILPLGIRVYIEVENTGETSINTIITAREIPSLGIFGDVGFPGVTVSPHSTVSLQADINPVNIQRFTDNTLVLDQKWKWIYSDFAHPDRNITETTQRIYIINSIPIQPWDASVQPHSSRKTEYIWTDILDICCKFCDDYNTAYHKLPTTPGEHLEAFTLAHNADPAFRYDIRRGESFYSILNGIQRTIKLQKYINDHNSGYYSYLNCTDCATILQILCRACGIAVTGVRIVEDNHPYSMAFPTNPVIAIGYDYWAVPFGNGFSYHEMATLDLHRNETTRIADACLKIDAGDFPSSDPDSGPLPAPKFPDVALGILFSETQVPVVHVPTGTAYTIRDFYRERLVAHGAACWIDPNIFVVDGISPTLAWQNEFTVKNFEYFKPMMEKYGLTENQLPPDAVNKIGDDLELEERFSMFKDSLLLEHYGRSRIYETQWNGESYRVEVTFALNENEAFAIVMNTLMSIAHPGVKRDGTDGLSFTIEGELLLRVKNNVVVKAVCNGKPDDSGLRSLVDHICESL